jgi:hypothetical protein
MMGFSKSARVKVVLSRVLVALLFLGLPPAHSAEKKIEKLEWQILIGAQEISFGA